MARTTERLSLGLQENLLALACFNPKAAPQIRLTVATQLFGSQLYRDVIGRVFDYLDQYKKPPGEHLPDLFDDILAKNDANAEQYGQLIQDLYETQHKVNPDFVLNQLAGFVRQQTIKASLIEAADAVQEGQLDKAESVLLKGLKSRMDVFSAGMGLEEGLQTIFAGNVRRDLIPLGIKELDAARFGPARGEFFLFIGPPKRGKTWFLVHTAKSALLHRKKVCVITLELSKAQWTQRIIQSLFSVQRHKARVPVTRLKSDDLGRLMRFEKDTINGRMSLDDTATRPILNKRLSKLHARDNFVVQQFPAGQLTVNGLDAYLDMLADTGFNPDFVVIDYPKYMKLDARNMRLEYGALMNDLRGLAVSRDVGMVVAGASNREGTKAKMVEETHAGEDYSQIFTADTILTYSQTGQEKELGLARLLASNTRVADRDGFVVLIAQAYPVGQFAIESTMMADNYWGMLGASTGAEKPEEEAE